MNQIHRNSVPGTVRLSDDDPREPVTLRGPISEVGIHLQRAYDMGSETFGRVRVLRFLTSAIFIGVLTLFGGMAYVSFMPFSIIDGIALGCIVAAWVAADGILRYRRTKRMRQDEGPVHGPAVRGLERQLGALNRVTGRSLHRSIKFEWLQPYGEEWIDGRLKRLEDLANVANNDKRDQLSRMERFRDIRNVMLEASRQAPAFIKMPKIPQEWILWASDD